MAIISSFSSLNATIILPEVLLTLCLVFVLCIDLFFKLKDSFWPVCVTLSGLSLCFIELVFQWNNSNTLAFLGSFQGDKLSIVFRTVLVLSCFICVLLSKEYVERSGANVSEYILLLLTATLGGMLLSGANDITLIFIGLECLSLPSYILTGYMKRDVRSNEAALKYLLIGGASTSILLYGLSFFYGLSGGKIEIYEISKALIDKHSIYSNVYWIALTCIIAAIAFKISAAPFHQWAPDVYEGSPTPVAAFFSVSSKAAGLALAVRIFSITVPFFQPQQQLILQACAILSMILGNVIAITQTSMKRMLAYSSIGQIGYLMIGLISATDNGYTSLLVYLSIYLFMNLGAFACVILFGLRTGTDEIRSYTGLFYKDAWLTCCLSICLLSLAGIPPFAGFFGKIYLFWAGWESGLYSLVLVGLITSVISMYYYLRVVKAMIAKEPTEMSFYTQNYKSITNLAFSSPLQISINVCTLFCLVLGILMSPLAQLFQQASIFNTLMV